MTKPATNGTLEVLTKQQVEDVDAIRSYHCATIKSFQDGIIYSFLCGARFESLKASVPYGEFRALRDAQFPDISKGAEDRHRLVYDALKDGFPTVGNLEPKLLPGPKADAKAQASFLSVVHERFDGKTVTAIWRELSIMRKAEHPKHTPAKEISPEEELEGRLAQLKSFFDSAIESLALIQELEDEDKGILPRECWDRLLNSCIPSAKLARLMMRHSKKQKLSRRTALKGIETMKGGAQ